MQTRRNSPDQCLECERVCSREDVRFRLWFRVLLAGAKVGSGLRGWRREFEFADGLYAQPWAFLSDVDNEAGFSGSVVNLLRSEPCLGGAEDRTDLHEAVISMQKGGIALRSFCRVELGLQPFLIRVTFAFSVESNLRIGARSTFDRHRASFLVEDGFQSGEWGRGWC